MAVDIIPFCRMKLHEDFIIRPEQLLDETHFRPIRGVSVGIESGFPSWSERWSLGVRFGFWDAP
jgi:hypothetical protein